MPRTPVLVWLRLTAGLTCFLTIVPISGIVRAGSAQTAQSASISGSVRDATGAVLPGAIVEVRASGRVVATTSTGAEGRFRLPVPPGVAYEVRVRRTGFAEQSFAVAGSAGETARDVTMSIGGVSDTVVVTAARAPESRERVTDVVSVLSAADAAALGSTSLAELMRQVPGVNVAANGREGSLTSLFSRGGESDYTLVLVDGVRVNQSGGAFDFSRVAAAEIERVEVVRGAQSALYGSDAMGAVVQVITKGAAPGERASVSGGIEAGTFDTWRGSAASSGGAGRRVDYHVAAAGRRTDGAFSDRLTEADTFDEVTLDAGAGVALGSRAALRTGVRVASADGRLVGPIAYGPGDTGTAYDSRDVSWHAELSHVLGSRATASATVAYFRSRSVSEDTIADPSFDVHAILAGTPGALFPESPRLVRLIDRAEFDALSAAGGAVPGGGLLAYTPFGVGDFPFSSVTELRRPAVKYQADFLWRAGRLTAGYEHERESSPLEREHRVKTNALFLQQQFSVRERWFATVGARVDDKSPFGSFVSPKLSVGGFVLPAGDRALSSLKVFLNAGSGIKSPQFSELFGGAGFDGNRDLEPERARSVDVGAELTFAGQSVRASVTRFDNRFHDMVEFRATGFTEDGMPDFVNIAGADAQGWEIEGVLQRPVFGFTARGSYTFVETEVTETTRTGTQFQPGQPLLRRPAHSGAVRAAYTAGRFTVHADAELRGRSHDSSFLFLTAVPTGVTTDITVLPGYALAGFTIDVRAHERMSFFLRANNVTNAGYETSLGFPGAPRSFFVGARLAPR